MLKALTLLSHLTTTRYSFPESPTKGHWHHVNGFLIRLHVTLSPRDAASKPEGSVTDIHILLPYIFTFMFLGTSASRSAYLQTKPRLIASARMSYFRSVRDHSWVHDSRKSTSPNSQAILPRRTAGGWVWRLMRGTNEAPKNSHTKHIYTLAERMGHVEDPLQLSGISRTLILLARYSLLIFSLLPQFIKLARLENHRVYIEAPSPLLKLKGVRKNILARSYIDRTST